MRGGGPSDLDKLRYPPTGDPDLWVKYGPGGPGGPPTHVLYTFAGLTAQELAEHTHRAAGPGEDCPDCGFPWWPPEAHDTPTNRGRLA